MYKQIVIDALFTSLARSEDLLHPTATLLPDFPRSIQLDFYSCGAKTTYGVLKFFGKHCNHKSIEKQLGTTVEGTLRKDIKRVLINYGLNIQVNSKIGIRDLKSAIKAGSPVIVSMYDNWHYSVVYGFSDTHLFVMNPSLGEMGSIKCAVKIAKFKEIFDGWGIVVSRK